MTTPIHLTAGTLKRALPGLTRAINRKCTLPVLGTVKIERREGAVRLTATDLDHWLTFIHPIEPPPLTDLGRKLAGIRWARDAAAVLVPLESLKAAAKAAGCNDAAVVTIRAEAIQYPLAGHPVSLRFDAPPVTEFPEDPPSTTTLPVRLGAVDRAAIVEAGTFSSEDEARHVLNGVYLEAAPPERIRIPIHGNAEASIVATDGRRMHLRPMASLAALGANMILPNRVLTLLGTPALMGQDWHLGRIPAPMKAAEDGTEYPDGCDRLCIAAGPWRLNCKLIEGSFPNFRQVIPSELDNHLTVALPAGPHDMLRTVLRQLPSSKKEGVTLCFHGTHLELHCDEGFTAVVPGITSDAPLAITFNRHFLADMLAIGPGSLRLLDEMTCAAYCTGTACGILMPMRGDLPPVPDPARDALEAEWKDREVIEREHVGTVVGVVRSGVRLLCRVKWAGSPDNTTAELPSTLRLKSDVPRAKTKPTNPRRRKAA